ncbi:Uncharacterised protein [Streptococcus pneumoniae]|nr:Uncharacterised protein [Streptococcus pneumoniae]
MDLARHHNVFVEHFLKDVFKEIDDIIRCCKVTLDNLRNLRPNLVVNI